MAGTHDLHSQSRTAVQSKDVPPQASKCLLTKPGNLTISHACSEPLGFWSYHAQIQPLRQGEPAADRSVMAGQSENTARGMQVCFGLRAAISGLERALFFVEVSLTTLAGCLGVGPNTCCKPKDSSTPQPRSTSWQI